MTAARFDLQDTGLEGLRVLRRRVLEDPRGTFVRLFCAEAFRDWGFAAPVSQINLTHTRRAGTLRGLHFQHPPHAEVKVVTCLRGRIFDVAVDLRRGSPTFLQWRGVTLSEADPTSLLIPAGFAHGFQTQTEDCELLYLHSAPYEPTAEAGLHPEDPCLQIHWPHPLAELSERDRNHPYLLPTFQGLSV
jgi:dTDP-4-dehydrorhamnose 3,5-epimerase